MKSDHLFSAAENGRILKVMLQAAFVYLVLTVVGAVLIAGIFPPPHADLTMAQVYDFYIDRGVLIPIGMAISITAVPFYYTWAIGVSRMMAYVEGPHGTLAHLQMGGAMWTCVLSMIATMSWLLAGYLPETRSPELTLLVHQLGWLTVDVPAMGTILQAVAFGAIALMDKRAEPLVPSWLGWYSLFCAFTFLGAILVPFFRTGPFAWHGLVAFWVVFPLFFIWIILVAVFLIKALARIQSEDADHARINVAAISNLQATV